MCDLQQCTDGIHHVDMHLYLTVGMQYNRHLTGRQVRDTCTCTVMSHLSQALCCCWSHYTWMAGGAWPHRLGNGSAAIAKAVNFGKLSLDIALSVRGAFATLLKSKLLL